MLVGESVTDKERNRKLYLWVRNTPKLIPMQILSVNVGLPKEYEWQGRTVRTAILKHPTPGPVRLAPAFVEGDEQANKRVHGGPNKAVYSYDAQFYTFWQEAGKTLEMGAFGENLTTEGLPDSEAGLGDTFRMGTAVLMVVQPRFPCNNLNVRFNDATMVKQFQQARRHGIYYKVLEAGQVGPGDRIERIETAPYGVTIQDVVDQFYEKSPDPAFIEKLFRFPNLTNYLKEHFS
ncbi:MAG: MOSC domain-containing protein [Cytophagales bacterium]|nr:MAG: MOSC domain-containing protein [Cytophagales bacterium]